MTSVSLTCRTCTLTRPGSLPGPFQSLHSSRTPVLELGSSGSARWLPPLHRTLSFFSWHAFHPLSPRVGLVSSSKGHPIAVASMALSFDTRIIVVNSGGKSAPILTVSKLLPDRRFQTAMVYLIMAVAREDHAQKRTYAFICLGWEAANPTCFASPGLCLAPGTRQKTQKFTFCRTLSRYGDI